MRSEDHHFRGTKTRCHVTESSNGNTHVRTDGNILWHVFFLLFSTPFTPTHRHPLNMLRLFHTNASLQLRTARACAARQSVSGGKMNPLIRRGFFDSAVKYSGEKPKDQEGKIDPDRKLSAKEAGVILGTKRSKTEFMFEIADVLNLVLSDIFVLNAKTKGFHWNIVGPQFRELHLLLEDQYKELDIEIDNIAEQVRYIRHKAAGSITEFLSLTQLGSSDQEAKKVWLNDKDMVTQLLRDHETVIRYLNEHQERMEDIDPSVGEFVNKLIQTHKKQARFLRSHLDY
ncbi:DNA protection during starvation protein 2 [Planoprotostelium fungivorum]|uniref:DNA protection during starvation protein 2 n=1 Tax=Planoprotostelium fungivorum TaxID=1890364 RepID=A0A2P6NL95_9EUKA|nr:DNA protection during starvation protein 2 [Planoprotostelium fungivorum]